MIFKPLFVGFIIAVIGVYTPAQQHQNSAEKHDKVSQHPSSPTPIPDATHISHVSTVIEESSPQGEHESFLKKAFAPEFFSNWILVLVGIGAIVSALCTLGTIRRQTKHIARQAVSMRRQTTILRRSVAATRKSAEATRKSVVLQEIQLRQWVVTQDWGASIFINFGAQFVQITFSIVNTTDLPLTIRQVTINKKEEIVKLAPRVFLPPGSGPHQVRGTFLLTPGEIAQWGKGKIGFNVTGEIEFEDALEKTRIQPFGQNCRWTPDRWDFRPYQGERTDKSKEA
jgi:hypothetical protein